MPKETFHYYDSNPEANQDLPALEIAWEANGDAVVVRMWLTNDTSEAFVIDDRKQVNRMLSVLRRARDNAMGKDE